MVDAAFIYAQNCTEAERRLDRVSAMLHKGSDYQALQVAEEEPPLLDLVAELSFGEEKNWQIYCDTHGLKSAPRLDANSVQELENLYAKGISANHPLYKDFRAAVLSRDDEKSIRIVKTILKLNPQDDNAQRELMRLENKALQEKMDELREALKTDDEERIATLTESIKAVAAPSKLERLDVFQQGEDVRAALRRRQAGARVPNMLAAIQKVKTEGRWRQVGQMLADLDSLFREHGLGPADDAQQSAINELTQYHAKSKAAEEKQRNFELTLKGFLSFVQEAETRLLTGSGVTYEEIAEKDESFVKRWKELEAYHLPVEAESLNRLRAVGQELRARLEGMQRGMRLRSMGLAAGALMLLFCVSAVGLHAWKAWTLTQELASYQSKENTGAAEDLIKKLRKEEDLLLRWPYLQAKIEEVNSWASKSRGIDKQAEDALLALEKSFIGDSSSLPPVKLVRQLDDAESLVKQLGGDLAASPRNRLAALKTKTDLHLTATLKQLTASTTSTLTELEQRSTSELSHEKLTASVTISIKAIEQQLKPLEALLKPEVQALTLPSDLSTRIRSLRQKVDTFQKDLNAFADIRAETARTTTLEEYRKAMAKWQGVKFAEAAPSLKMLDTMPSDKAFQAALFTGGDQEVLQAVLSDKSGRQMAPDTLLGSELKTILGLIHDEFLNNIFENNVSHYSSKKPSSTFWSVGKPEQSIIGSSTRWSAKFYEPDVTQTTALFIQRSLTRVGIVGEYQGDAVITSRLSQTSEMMNQLALNRVTDERGERVLQTILEVCDKLVQDTHDAPVAKACVFLKLENMMQLRPRDWGLHYCPSLQQDLRRLHQVLGNSPVQSEDWLVQSSREKWTAPLAEFFASCKNRSYQKEANAHRTYLRAAITAGLKFAGYVEPDLTLSLNQLGRGAPELWMLGKEGGRPLMAANPSTSGSGTSSRISAPGAVVLSPVFYVPADRQALLRQYREALSASGSGADIKPSSGESLFLTQP